MACARFGQSISRRPTEHGGALPAPPREVGGDGARDKHVVGVASVLPLRRAIFYGTIRLCERARADRGGETMRTHQRYITLVVAWLLVIVLASPVAADDNGAPMSDNDRDMGASCSQNVFRVTSDADVNI